MTNNHLSNGSNSIAMGSANSIAQGNLITRMRHDGIDFYNSNQIIKRNTVKDEVNHFSTDIIHPDGIQGWSILTNGVAATNKNIIIDGNAIIQVGDGNVNQLQGISIFDGDWDGVQIINNVVVTDVYNGVTMAEGKNVSIMNNTILGSDPKFMTWINIRKTKSQQNGTNIVLRNNIVSTLKVGYPGPIYDHNIIASHMFVRDAAAKLSTYTSGTIGNDNKIAASVVSGFVTADASTATYDLRLRPTSIAVAAGINTGAPLRYIVNRVRSNPFDIGAYKH